MAEEETETVDIHDTKDASTHETSDLDAHVVTMQDNEAEDKNNTAAAAPSTDRPPTPTHSAYETPLADTPEEELHLTGNQEQKEDKALPESPNHATPAQHDNELGTSAVVESAANIDDKPLPQSPVSSSKTDTNETLVVNPAGPDDERPAIPPRKISEGISKKMTGTFSWLSRATNMRKTSGSPPRQDSSGLGAFAMRRVTSSSANTLNTLNSRSGPETSPHRAVSLQDRFAALRMEEEAREAIEEPETATPAEQPKSPQSEAVSDLPPVSPDASESVRSRSRSHTAVDTKLPPGTAAGMVMGPSPEAETPVNWDLWQSLVYEGPTAVARTSGQELNEAIQNGIPATIRGVVWQVLADSKSEDLETVYRSLLGKENANGSKTPDPPKNNDASKLPTNGEKESIASSASSIRSHSSAQQTMSTSATSPQPGASEHAHEEDDQVPQLPLRKKSGD